MKLRQYQQKLKYDIYQAWKNGAKNVLAVLPCGGGKTVIFSKIISQHKGACCVIAHRQEITCQISLALAREDIKHRIIGPQDLIKNIVSLHIMELGKSYYDPCSQCAVAGVDTLVRRETELYQWSKQVTLWVQDEAHHVLRNNKWGKAIAMFTNAKGVGLTATPERLDCKGLGSHSDGVFHCIVQGATERELIKWGYLCGYRIFCPKSDLDLIKVTIGQKTKEYGNKSLKTAIQESSMVGDVVKSYKQFAYGKLAIVFASDIETATSMSKQYNEEGVPSEIIHANTGIIHRANIIKSFKNKELLTLVNVDILGEGVDLPCVEVIINARPSKSYVRYKQAVFRCFRIMEGKENGMIIDHVGGWITHGLPDDPRIWTLDNSEGAKKPINVVTLRICPKCTFAFTKLSKICLNCGYKIEFQNRSSVKFVDGDLTELDKETIDLMRKKIDQVDLDPEVYRSQLMSKHCPLIGQSRHVKSHIQRQVTQHILRAWIKYWSGLLRGNGYDDGQIYTIFYLKFNIDMLSAMTLKTKLAEKLTEQIKDKFYDNSPFMDFNRY